MNWKTVRREDVPAILSKIGARATFADTSLKAIVIGDGDGAILIDIDTYNMHVRVPDVPPPTKAWRVHGDIDGVMPVDRVFTHEDDAKAFANAMNDAFAERSKIVIAECVVPAKDDSAPQMSMPF